MSRHCLHIQATILQYRRRRRASGLRRQVIEATATTVVGGALPRDLFFSWRAISIVLCY
jgi:hypothetical protein